MASRIYSGKHKNMYDTSPEIEERMARMIAEKTPAERLRMASSMFDAAKKLMIAGLLRENSTLNEAQLRARIFLRLYGDCFSKEEVKRIMEHIPNMQLDGDFE